MAKPNLALIPAAQGSKLFSVLPSSGVGDFDFSRSGKATRINSQGLIEEVSNGQSRLNYPMIDGKVVGCPHHILEPARTNLLQYSEDFSNSYWYKDSISVTSGFVSPDGTLNASKIVGSGFLQGVINVVASNVYTYSVFWKKDTSSFIKFQVSSSGPDETITLNTKTLSFSSITNIDEYSVEEFGNGWYRLKITWTEQDTEISGIRIICDESDANSSLYIWGAQVEQGSFPTSYIKTNGSAVTRSAETANGSGDAATFNDSEGVLMAEISALADDGTYRVFGLSDGTASNRVILYYNPNSNNIELFISSGGAAQTTLSLTLTDIKLLQKIAVKYKVNDIGLWINGFEVGIDTIATMPSGLNELAFDNSVGTENFYGNTKQLQYYNSALTESELEQLTSWTSFTDMAEGQLYTIE
jgi:hypothetical protein